MAVTIGLLCAHLVNPGSFISENDQAALVAQFEAVAARRQRSSNGPIYNGEHPQHCATNPVQSLASGCSNIFFAVIFGIALTLMPNGKSEIVITFLTESRSHGARHSHGHVYRTIRCSSPCRRRDRE